ncbi:MAG: ribosomal L7Ae/L30e/S12e/Gadd45 family protein [Clostridia bacterium]|nr:ribosomal L7Ae/L30e/S12e/Gadd45 family protein [Clostridia bacterium]
MVNQKIRSYFGFAVRSGAIVYGADTILRSTKRPHLVAISEDINETAAKRLTKYCENKSIKLLVFLKGEIADLVHRENCKCAGILDKNLASAIITQRNELPN